MTQDEYKLRCSVERKLAAMKQSGRIADFKFVAPTWVLIYFNIPVKGNMPRKAEALPIHKVFKRLSGL